MTDDVGRGLGDAGRPWSVDQLADLHAGVYDDTEDTDNAADDTEAGRMWHLAQADPGARSVLAALDSTRAALANYGRQPSVDRIPDLVAARLDAAIAEELRARPGPVPAQGPRADTAAPESGGQVVDLAAARRRRNRRLGWASGVVAAAAAVVAIGAVVLPGLNRESGTPVAQAPAPPAPGAGLPGGGSSGPLALTSGNLKQAAPAALGARDYGPLRDPQRLAGCLSANNAGAPNAVAGIKPLTLDGRPGMLMLLTTGKTGQFRLLVVSQDCAAGHPGMLADSTVGGFPTPPR